MIDLIIKKRNKIKKISKLDRNNIYNEQYLYLLRLNYHEIFDIWLLEINSQNYHKPLCIVCLLEILIFFDYHFHIAPPKVVLVLFIVS